MKVLFAGGGTGGHLLPGILIARRLAAQGDQVRFLVSGRAVEEPFFAGQSLDRVTLTLERRGGGAPGRTALALRLPAAVYRSAREIGRFGPDVVVGIGGYVSFPAGLAAHLCRVPLDLLEVNSVPGRATSALRPFARRVYCGFEETRRRVGRKGVLCGSPLREDLGRLPQAEARESLGLDRLASVLLVVGGSQGAASLNRAVLGSLERLRDLGVQLVHLTGPRDFEVAEARVREVGVRALVSPFLREMPLAYAAADLALCRGGAATVAELAAAGLPAVVVPYPLHRDRHQWWNGRQLREGALLLEEKEFLEWGMEKAVLPLLRDRERLRRMAARAREASRPCATETIVSWLRS